MKKPNFEARTECEVMKINLRTDGKTAKSVTYMDASGNEYEQPGDIILLCGYGLMNVRMMLLSGIGKPYDPKSAEGRGGAQLLLPDRRRRRAAHFRRQAFQSLYRRRRAWACRHR